MQKILYTFFLLLILGNWPILAKFHSNYSDDDPFGLNLRKLILGQLFDELPKKGMPSATYPTDSNKVFVFFVAKKNVTTYMTDLLKVQMYSDSTWPSTKDTKLRFANSMGLSLEKIAFVGYFEDSLSGREAWNNYKDKAFAYEINRFTIDFNIEPNFNNIPSQSDALSVGATKPKSQSRETKVINLPDITVTVKYRPNIGIMPIIDTETNLNQQFLICQYLKDNPIILNGKDTLMASLTDYRSYTQYALGGTMDGNLYSLKLWQKEKLLAEIAINLGENTSLEQRMTSIGHQLGRILSGNSDNYRIKVNMNTRNLFDDMNVIKSEVRKSTAISTLFPDATTQYLPQNFSLPNELNHLSTRIINKPYLQSPAPNLMAQKVRGIYQQSDEKQFFFTNGNVPEEMKTAVRKITQPTSRRMGAALSYVAVGDAFKNAESNLDGAACSYYSALLLAHNLAASPLEKATVKQLVYQRMKQVAESRKQPYLSELFGLAADLNTSFINSEFARASHQEYYSGLQKTAAVCANTEIQARAIRAQQRTSTFQTIVAVAGAVAQVSSGKTITNLDAQILTNQIQSFVVPVQQSKAIFAESLRDLNYENFEVKDESGNEIEINKLYLNLEVSWHLGLRKDQATVGKRLLEYAADKPNLKVALEEYIAETDEGQQATAIAEFQKHFQGIEAQANSYESWGKKLPKKVLARF